MKPDRSLPSAQLARLFHRPGRTLCGVAENIGAMVIILACGTLRAEDPIPKPLPASHFEKLAAHSPFSPPTQTVAAAPTPPPLQPKTFEKYTVVMLMQQGNDYIATLNNKETSEHTRVRTNGPENEEGVTLASVEWANDPNQTKITLRKGTEFGVVGFDPTGVASSPAAPVSNPGLTRPGMPMRPIAPPAGGFRPPPGLPPGIGMPPGGQAGANTARRAAIIRGPTPPPRQMPHPGQPGVNFSNAPQRPAIPGAGPLPVPSDDNDPDDN